MGALINKAIKLILKEVEKEAKRILQECVDERDYKHDTLNLYDSYGYGIYLQGKLHSKGFLSADSQAEKGKKWYGETLYGRDEITKYLETEYQPVGFIDVAIAAAMPYAKVLEAGGGGVKKKYKVISMSFEKLDKIASAYNGVVVTIK